MTQLNTNTINFAPANTSGSNAGGAGTAINASIFIDDNGSTFIKCNKGEISDSDTVALARYTTCKSRKDRNNYRARTRGWIAPNAGSLEKYGLAVQMSLDHSDDTSDYWAVELTSGKTFQEYEEWVDSEPFGAKDEGKGAYSLNHKMGVAVFRGGIRITDYLHFKVVANTKETGETKYYMGRW